jgi:hypothetical protein
MSRPRKRKAISPSAEKTDLVSILSTSIQADIRSIKEGNLDEIILRDRLQEFINKGDTSSKFVQLTLWLIAFAAGAVDDLVVDIQPAEDDIKIDVLPIIRNKPTKVVSVIPIPKKEQLLSQSLVPVSEAPPDSHTQDEIVVSEDQGV